MWGCDEASGDLDRYFKAIESEANDLRVLNPNSGTRPTYKEDPNSRPPNGGDSYGNRNGNGYGGNSAMNSSNNYQGGSSNYGSNNYGGSSGRGGNPTQSGNGPNNFWSAGGYGGAGGGNNYSGANAYGGSSAYGNSNSTQQASHATELYYGNHSNNIQTSQTAYGGNNGPSNSGSVPAAAPTTDNTLYYGNYCQNQPTQQPHVQSAPQVQAQAAYQANYNQQPAYNNQASQGYSGYDNSGYNTGYEQPIPPQAPQQPQAQTQQQPMEGQSETSPPTSAPAPGYSEDVDGYQRLDFNRCLISYNDSPLINIRHVFLSILNRNELMDYAVKILESACQDKMVICLQRDNQLCESFAAQLRQRGYWSFEVTNKTSSPEQLAQQHSVYRSVVTTMSFLRDNTDMFKLPSVIINFDHVIPRVKFLERFLNYRSNLDGFPNDGTRQEIYIYQMCFGNSSTSSSLKEFISRTATQI